MWRWLLTALAVLLFAPPSSAAPPAGPPAVEQQAPPPAIVEHVRVERLVVVAADENGALVLVEEDARIVEVLAGPAPRFLETHVRLLALTSWTHVGPASPLAAEAHRAWRLCVYEVAEGREVYAYASGNPVSNVDPMGTDALEDMYRKHEPWYMKVGDFVFGGLLNQDPRDQLPLKEMGDVWNLVVASAEEGSGPVPHMVPGPDGRLVNAALLPTPRTDAALRVVLEDWSRGQAMSTPVVGAYLMYPSTRDAFRSGDYAAAGKGTKSMAANLLPLFLIGEPTMKGSPRFGVIARDLLHGEEGAVPFMGGGPPAPLQVGELTTYADFVRRSEVGDLLEGHEPWQFANQKAQGLATRRNVGAASKGNPVIVLPREVHGEVSAAQAGTDAATQSSLENIEANMKILRAQEVAEKEVLDRLEAWAREHAQSQEPPR